MRVMFRCIVAHQPWPGPACRTTCPTAHLPLAAPPKLNVTQVGDLIPGAMRLKRTCLCGGRGDDGPWRKLACCGLGPKADYRGVVAALAVLDAPCLPKVLET